MWDYPDLGNTELLGGRVSPGRASRAATDEQMVSLVQMVSYEDKTLFPVKTSRMIPKIHPQFWGESNTHIYQIRD